VTRADAARAEVCAICLCEPECGDAHSMRRVPPWQRHSSLAWPPVADSPGSWLRLLTLLAALRTRDEPLRRRRCSREAGPDSPILQLGHSQVVCTLACAHSFHKACVTQRRRLLEAPPWQCRSLPPRPPGTQGCASGPPYTFERSASAAQTPRAAFGASACPRLWFCGVQHPGGCSARSSARSARRTRWVRRRSRK